MKIKIGDTIKVMAGKDKGREGKIERVFPKKGTAMIPGINVYKKHVKGSAMQKGQKGGIYDIPRPLMLAKLALICPKCKKITRVGFKLEGKEKLRICRKCKREIDSK